MRAGGFDVLLAQGHRIVRDVLSGNFSSAFGEAPDGIDSSDCYKFKD